MIHFDFNGRRSLYSGLKSYGFSKKALPIVVAFLSSFGHFGYAQYCTASLYVNGCLNNAYIDNLSIGSISQTATGCGGGSTGYSDYTSLSTDLEQGSNYLLTVTAGSELLVAAWIDFNNDFIFDSSEKVTSDFICETPFVAFSSYVTIPCSAIPGIHRLRVRAINETDEDIDPCIEYEEGEAEDYSVNIIPGSLPLAFQSATCLQNNLEVVSKGMNDAELIGVPVLVNGCTDSLDAISFSINANGSTNFSSDVTQVKIYYTGDNPDFTPSNLFASSADLLTPITGMQSLTAGWNYFWIAFDVSLSASLGDVLDAECTEIKFSGTGGTQVPEVTAPAGSRKINYCIPSYDNDCSSGAYINKFSINTLNNSSSGCNGNDNNYILYPASGNTTTTLQLGGSYNLSLKSVSAVGYGVWIDYNDDADFDDPGEFVYSSPFYDNILFNGTIIIPNNAAFLGQRRLRVRSGLETLISENDYCTDFSNGETEDYLITINPAPACSGAPVAGILSAFPSSICAGGNTSELHVSGYSVASNISIQWETSDDGSSWTTIPGATSNVYTTAPLYDTTYYRTKITCDLSGEFAYTNEVKITIGEVEIISVTNDTICGPGTATLSVTANAEFVSWFENAAGGIPLYTSTSPSVYTPTVNGNTTFYASASSGVLYIDSIGPLDKNIGSGADSYLNDYLLFNVEHPCSIVGVYVFPAAEGNVIIQLRDANFNVIKTDTFIITANQVNQKTFLELDEDVVPGNGYQLTLKDGSVPLFSNQSGVNYPYAIPDVISIYNSNLGPAYYFYYYNWVINYTDECETPRRQVHAVVNIPPVLSLSSNPDGATICGNAGLNVELFASSGYTDYTWSPAIGLSATTGTDVFASPTVTTTYTVFASDSICQNNESITVVIANTPSVSITATADSICGGNAAQLFAAATPLLNYKVDQIDFDPDTSTGTIVPLGEDDVSPLLPIGFPFKFYGSFYTEFKISANGFIAFDTLVFNGCCAGQKLPDIFVPNNLIAFAWEDYSPQLGGAISYTLTGTAPYRKLVVRFDSILHYSLTGGTDPVTSEIELYETSNNIEIHTTSMPGNPSGLWFVHTEGIENSTGTLGAAVPGRNASNTWTATNDAWRFTPIEYSYSWSPSVSLNDPSFSNPVATPAATTNYTVTVMDTSSQCSGTGSLKIRVITTPEAGSINPGFEVFCDAGSDTLSLNGYTTGASIQWQQSSLSGGPYNSIAGATNSSYITPTIDTPMYYVAQVTCTNTTLTDEAIMEVLPVPAAPTAGDDSVFRCGPGKVDLAAFGNGGSISWFDSQTGGNYLGAGSTFTTQPILQSSTFWAEEGPQIASPLPTTFIGGALGDGNMFDIHAINPIVITGFDGHIGISQSADIEIYYKNGTYAGFENDKEAWTLLGSAANVPGQGIGIPTAYPIELNVTIPAGSTYAFYITSKTENINYSFGTSAGNVFAADDNIEVKEGNTINYQFGPYTKPVQWNGIVHYNTIGCPGPRTPVNAIIYNPQIAAQVSNPEICEGDTIILSAENTGMGNFIYQWTPLLTTMNPPNGIGESVTVAPSTSATFTLTATEVSNSCDTAISIPVLVHPSPVASFTGLPDTVAVTDNPFNLTGNPAGGIFSGNGISGNVFDPAVAGIGGPYAITYSYTDANGCFDDTLFFVVVVLDIGIHDPLNVDGIVIYPNPNNGQFVMNMHLPFVTDGLVIRIRDVFGRVMFEKEYSGNHARDYQSFDFSGWVKGSYFVEVIANGKLFNRRFEIQ